MYLYNTRSIHARGVYLAICLYVYIYIYTYIIIILYRYIIFTHIMSYIYVYCLFSSKIISDGQRGWGREGGLGKEWFCFRSSRIILYTIYRYNVTTVGRRRVIPDGPAERRACGRVCALCNRILAWHTNESRTPIRIVVAETDEHTHIHTLDWNTGGIHYTHVYRHDLGITIYCNIL